MEDFKLKWAYGVCTGLPMFVSNEDILVPCGVFFKRCDLSGRVYRKICDPGIRIGCAASLPELGVLAISEKKEKALIYVLNYPSMKVMSVLNHGSSEEYQALSFTGIEFLVSLKFRICHEIDLWRWSSGERLQSLSTPLAYSEVPLNNLSVDPMLWYSLCIQSNIRLIFLHIKYSDEKYHLYDRSVELYENQNKSFYLNSKDNSVGSNIDVRDDFKPLRIACYCWLPGSNLFVATATSLFKVNYINSAVVFIYKFPEGKSTVTSMVLNTTGLFVGYKTGCIDVFSMTNDLANLKESIAVGQSIMHLQFSFDYETLIITTSKTCVLLHKDGSKSLTTVLSGDILGDLAACMIAPLSRLCVIAKKNGLLHLLKSTDGSHLSSIQLDEEISSVSASPLCCYIAVGSVTGFLYFIEVTDLSHPKIVHCTKPYEIPIERIKFDNFGQLIVTSAQSQSVKLWNALPSSDFRFLGMKKVSRQVKDIALFGRASEEDKLLLILCEGGLSSEKEAGNILIRLKLPSDFNTDPNKYRIDVFGNLCGDLLCFQKWELNYPCSKVDFHLNFGAVLYSPVIGRIRKYPVWSETSFRQADLLQVKNVSHLQISLNQRWLAVTDIFGCLRLYSTKFLTLSAVIYESSNSEGIVRSFLSFSNFGSGLLMGKENGTFLFYEWVSKFPEENIIPEWMHYIHSHFKKENSILHEMVEEVKASLIEQNTSNTETTFCSLAELQREFEMNMDIICFKLNTFTHYSINEGKKYFKDDFIINKEKLRNLSEQNTSKLQKITMETGKENRETQLTKNEDQVSDQLEEGKIITSINMGFVIMRYPETDTLMHRQEQLLDSDVKSSKKKHEAKQNLTSTDYNFFKKGMQFKSYENVLMILRNIMEEIFTLKKEFNKEFDTLYAEKDNIDNSISGMRFNIKIMAENLPSKAERDFWTAYLMQQNLYSLQQDLASSVSDTSLPSRDGLYQTSGKDIVAEAKNSIQSLIEDLREIQTNFDSEVERLFFKKVFCDYIIHRYEMKIFCALLYTFIEKECLKWKKETQEELQILENFQEQCDLIMSLIFNTEKNLREVYTGLLKLERNTDFKFESKSHKFALSKEFYDAYKCQPLFKLQDDSKNPYWAPLSNLTSQDLTAELNNATDTTCPKYIDKGVWKDISGKKNRCLKLGIILRYLQQQAVEQSKVRSDCENLKQNLTSKRKNCSKLLDDASKLLLKLNETFHTLLTINFENTDIKFNGDARKSLNFSACSNMENLPSPDDQFWKEIRMSTYKNQKLQEKLEEVEKYFEVFPELRVKIDLKRRRNRLKYPSWLAQLTANAEQHKEKFTKSKSAIDEVAEGKRKGIFKYLPSKS
ncbi:cilia- and flagella-associated protein 43-like [Stegodyphus dumicola]|uniref:cilia- and flagella-associated protein 43-like n=1 Tax=Stegodyphus dumicola TaxID=202533 RepID=UPI0015ADEB56|nr:cilia- and flagella-associated protein 43-like [Stegodyphus dumicola]